MLEAPVANTLLCGMGQGIIVGLADGADGPRLRERRGHRPHLHHRPASARVFPDHSLHFAERLFPVIWIAVLFQVLSGFSLWMTKPAKYLSAGMFDAKFSFVVIGVIVTAIFQSKLRREAGAWEASGKVSPGAVRLSIAAAFIWAAVLTTGRLTAYLGQLYS